MKYSGDNSVSVSLSEAGGCNMDTLLHDQLFDSDNKNSRKIPVKVVAENGVVNINIKGYDFNHNNGIITLEIWDEQLRLLVWADNQSEEPTHIISLEDAKELKEIKTKKTKKIKKIKK
jgi:hypothetical protein